jgi:hypothetical protein
MGRHNGVIATHTLIKLVDKLEKQARSTDSFDEGNQDTMMQHTGLSYDTSSCGSEMYSDNDIDSPPVSQLSTRKPRKKKEKGTFSIRVRRSVMLPNEDHVPSSISSIISRVRRSKVLSQASDDDHDVNNKNNNNDEDLQSSEIYQAEETQESRDDTETQRCSNIVPQNADSSIQQRKKTRVNEIPVLDQLELNAIRTAFEQLDKTQLTLAPHSEIGSPRRDRSPVRTNYRSPTTPDPRMVRFYETYQMTCREVGIVPRSYSHFVKHRYMYLAGNKEQTALYNGFFDN